MPTWNESLQDEIVEAQTDLMRLASATAEDLIEILDRTDAAIKAILLDLEISGAVTDAQYAEIRRAQEQIATDIFKAIKKYKDNYEKIIQSEL